MNDEQRPHHPFSPSTLGSLEACPCYQSQQSATPHERTTAGTRAHAVVESGIDDERLSDDDAEAAVFCMEFIAQRRQLMGAGAIQLTEEYFPVDNLEFGDVGATTAGYADAALLDAARENGEIIDHKFGNHKVENAATNLQGIGYFLGLMHRYPTLKQVRVFFVQPLVNYVTDAIFKREQVPELLLRVRAVVERARIARSSGSFENATPTTPNCLFCANVGRCPALLKLALHVGKKFAPLLVPESVDSALILDPRQTKQALQLAGVLKVWAEGFRQSVTNRVLCGDAIVPEGYKLASSSSKRVILDEEKYRATALLHLTSEEYQATLSPSLTKVEKIISAKAPRGQKTAAVDSFGLAAEIAGAVKPGEPFTFLKATDE